MPEDKLEDKQKKEINVLSIFDKKMKDLLVEFDNHLDNIGGNYGSILVEELNNRLEIIVKKFNDEVYMLFNESCEKWRVKNLQIRQLLKKNTQGPNIKHLEKKVPNPSSPKFIKDVDFGSLRKK